jgi:hypothetical protein
MARATRTRVLVGKRIVGVARDRQVAKLIYRAALLLVGLGSVALSKRDTVGAADGLTAGRLDRARKASVDKSRWARCLPRSLN